MLQILQRIYEGHGEKEGTESPGMIYIKNIGIKYYCLPCTRCCEQRVVSDSHYRDFHHDASTTPSLLDQLMMMLLERHA